jgi:hypothetical protein
MMHVHRAALGAAFFTATRLRNCACGKQTDTQNQGQGNADSFEHDQSNSSGILIHSDLVYIISIYHVNKKNRKVIVGAKNVIIN